MPETISHPLFGSLRWESKCCWWEGQIQLPSGNCLDVIVDPGNGDPVTFVDRAAQLFRKGMDAEQEIRRAVCQKGALKLYEDWRNEEEPELTAEQLRARLELAFVRIDTVVPLTLAYGLQAELEDVFGGKSVNVMVNENCEVLRVNLT